MKKIKKMEMQLILSVAEKHFMEKGYEKTQIKDIANEVELSVGTIYNLFESKENLFLFFVENKVQTIMDDVCVELSKEKDPLQRLRLHINTKIKEVIRHKDLLEGRNIPYNIFSFRPINDNTNNPRHKIIELLQETFKEMASNVKFSTDDYIQIAYNFLGITDAYIQRWMYENINLVNKKEEILTTFLKSVCV